MISVKNVGKKFNDSYVFKDTSFSINKGDFFGIIGESGSGKTTLLNCIGQLESLDHGSILIDGEKIKNKRLFFKNTVGFLFQNFALIDNQTVKNNLKIVTKDENVIYDELKKFGIEHLLNKKVYKLSGGEQQRIALVRAIIKQPKLILADEPTASLDEKNAKLVIDALSRINKKGVTVVIVTHDKRLLPYFDKIIKLKKRTN